MNTSQWSSLKFFSEKEKSHDGELAFPDPDKMSFKLMKMLDRARHIADVPFSINSSFREGDKKTHGRGEAVDIHVESSQDRFRMLKAFIAVGFERIGIYDKHFHVDIGLEVDGFAPEVSWWGKST